MTRRVRLSSVCAALAILVVATGAFTTNALAQGKGADPHAAPNYTGPFPPIRVTPPTANFGIANPDQPIHTAVTITNTSSSAIHIKEVRPTCKCTVPTLPKDTLAPGEQITVPVVLDLRGSLGEVKKPFDIFVTGWERPVTVVVAGVLSYPISVDPDKPQATMKRKGEITLRSTDGRPFKVISVHGREPQVVEKKPKEGDRALEWTIQWDVAHVQDFPYMLVLETDHPECEVFTVRFWGQLVSGPEVEFIKNWKYIFSNRTNVNFGAVPPGGSTEIEIPISRTDHSVPCEITFDRTKVEHTLPEGLRAEVIAVNEVDGRPQDEMYVIRLTNTAPTKTTICAPLYFRTGSEEGDKLTRSWIGGVLHAQNDG